MVFLFSAVIAIVALTAVAFFIIGPARIWRIAGAPDLGDVAFETLQRRTTPNDALACPKTLCRSPIDIEPPVYAVDAPSLRLALARALTDEPRLQQVAADDVRLTDRWIQRSALLQFPDTIVVRILDAGPDRSTLAIYSRSQIGVGDMGANRARIARWLAHLTRDVPLAP